MSLCKESGNLMAKFWWGTNQIQGIFVELVGKRSVSQKRPEVISVRVSKIGIISVLEY